MGDNEFANDLNKIFIPCRTVIEMEMATGLLLGSISYDNIRDVPSSRPNAETLIDLFDVRGNEPLMKIIRFFIDVALEKLKPVVMYERDHHDQNRVGKVIAYTKTRDYLFFALHRLKFKLLLLHSFFQMVKTNTLSQSIQKILQDQSLLDAIGAYYYEMHTLNLELMLPTGSISQNPENMLLKTTAVTNEKIFDMATYKLPDEEHNDIKYIMRGIKAAQFVCKLMFAKIDVPHPFTHVKDATMNPEELLISQDFIPELIPTISQGFAENNIEKVMNSIGAFEYLMNIVLESIDGAYEIASEGQVHLEREHLPFNTGIHFYKEV